MQSFLQYKVQEYHRKLEIANLFNQMIRIKEYEELICQQRKLLEQANKDGDYRTLIRDNYVELNRAQANKTLALNALCRHSGAIKLIRTLKKEELSRRELKKKEEVARPRSTTKGRLELKTEVERITSKVFIYGKVTTKARKTGEHEKIGISEELTSNRMKSLEKVGNALEPLNVKNSFRKVSVPKVLKTNTVAKKKPNNSAINARNIAENFVMNSLRVTKKEEVDMDGNSNFPLYSFSSYYETLTGSGHKSPSQCTSSDVDNDQDSTGYYHPEDQDPTWYNQRERKRIRNESLILKELETAGELNQEKLIEETQKGKSELRLWKMRLRYLNILEEARQKWDIEKRKERENERSKIRAYRHYKIRKNDMSLQFDQKLSSRGFSYFELLPPIVVRESKNPAHKKIIVNKEHFYVP